MNTDCVIHMRNTLHDFSEQKLKKKKKVFSLLLNYDVLM